MTSAKDKNRILRGLLVKQCLSLVEDLRSEMPPNALLDSLGKIFKTAIKLLGKKMIFDDIREILEESAEDEAYRNMVLSGVCADCRKNPSVPRTVLCPACHEKQVALNALVDFENFKITDRTEH
jgi:hypothetical protein